MSHQKLENAILVTGAGRRVGFHLAQRFQQAGYTVIAHYRTYTDEVESLENMGIATIQADFSGDKAILHFVNELQSRCQSFRALIHNASCFTPTSEDITEAIKQYQQFFETHMLAPYIINQGLHNLLVGEQGHPADIIHITDINVENPTAKFDIYGTTKAGLHNMTLALAKKFAPNIKVNAVAPGPILFASQHNEASREQMLQETLLAKEGGAEPVYLAIKALMDNPFITATSLPVDGGRRLSKR